MFNHIIVAFDNSKSAEKALNLAMELAVCHRSLLEVVSVVHLPDFAGTIDEVDEILKKGREFYQEAHKKAITEAEQRGVKLSSQIIPGHAGETVVNYANEHGADLIAMGSRGRSGITTLILGSVSTYVLRHAKCPVLVVR